MHNDATVANRDGRDFGSGIAHTAVSRRPPIPLYTMVPRTHMYTHDANVWDLSIVQGPFYVALCQTLALRFATFASLYALSHTYQRLPLWMYSPQCVQQWCRCAMMKSSFIGPPRISPN